jgi:hypothetical protein
MVSSEGGDVRQASCSDVIAEVEEFGAWTMSPRQHLGWGASRPNDPVNIVIPGGRYASCSS